MTQVTAEQLEQIKKRNYEMTQKRQAAALKRRQASYADAVDMTRLRDEHGLSYGLIGNRYGISRQHVFIMIRNLRNGYYDKTVYHESKSSVEHPELQPGYRKPEKKRDTERIRTRVVPPKKGTKVFFTENTDIRL